MNRSSAPCASFFQGPQPLGPAVTGLPRDVRKQIACVIELSWLFSLGELVPVTGSSTVAEAETGNGRFESLLSLPHSGSCCENSVVTGSRVFIFPSCTRHF